jgi:hypothetical protein
MPKVTLQFYIVVLLIAVAAVSRVVPHAYNFSPLGAIALFGAAYFSQRWLAFAIPLLAAFFSDLYLNNIVYATSEGAFVWFYQGFYWVYGAYALTVLLGFFVFTKVSVGRVGVGALVGAVLFYLVTNFACWPGSSLYSQDLGGLMTCMAAGIPFFKGTLAGNVLYSIVLFGAYHLLSIRFPQLKQA